jgi:hypothetical protein
MDERNDTGSYDTAPFTPRRDSYPQQPQYVPQAAKRSKTPIVLTGIGGLVLGLIIGYGAGHGSKTATDSSPIVTATTSAPAAAQAAHSSSSAARKTAAPAKAGDSIALAGMHNDEKLTVTLVKFADPATVTDQFMQPDAGKRYIAVQIRITNTASTAYSDSPTNGAKLIDAQGQQYDLTFVDTSLGQNFSGSVKLAPGATALGVMEFEMPTSEKAVTFQFTLDSGFADQTGQWQLS